MLEIMKNKIELFGLTGIPIIKEGDNIASIIFNSLKTNDYSIKDGDIIVIAQSIISKSIGSIRDLKAIKVSEEAYELYKKISPIIEKTQSPIKSPELIQAILDESKEVIKSEHALIVETKHGFVCANAGIDKSNAGGQGRITLLPNDSDKEATKIRTMLKELTGKQIAVIISDSFGRPFRSGAVGVAVGISGIDALLDKRGSKDLFGNILESTIVGQIDNLTSAAQLIMGEADEGLPIVIIRGYNYKFSDSASIKHILRDKSLDLFRPQKEDNIIFKHLKSRRSYKLEFSAKEVERKIIEECIDCARWAPSAHNNQYWRYVILEKNTKRELLVNEMNKKLKEDLKKDGKSNSFISQKINKTRKNFLSSPFLVLLCLDTKDFEKKEDEERNQLEFLMGVQSVSSSATYFLIALQAKGLASCWYCAPLFAKEAVNRTLNLPQSFIPMAFFTIGVAQQIPNTPTRKDLEEIIFKV